MVLLFSFKRNEDELFLFAATFVNTPISIPLYNKNENFPRYSFVSHSYPL